MRGTWWKWLSAVLAIICGLLFGWIAGAGLVQAAPLERPDAGLAECAGPAPQGPVADQPRRAFSQSSVRCQPSSASVLR
jgi:hypothetical protein